MINGERTARVTVSRTPDEETARKIEAFVKERGCCRVEYTVDEGIVGGVVIQIGDAVYDGSVKGRLGNIRQAL